MTQNTKHSANIGFDTLALHAGQQPDAQFGARAVPIYQTSSYVFPDSDKAASLFNMESPGHAYSRLSNPTTAVLEERIAALENGVGAIATASGQAALHLTICTLLSAGDHIVASQAIYGGSHNLLSYTLPRFGITTSFVDMRDQKAVNAAIQDNTKMIFGEVVGNPGNDILNIPAIADIANTHKIPLVIDSTFTPPCLCQPIEHGAHIVIHSATKYLSGHGIVIGGIVVDSGKFDWQASGKFPTMTEPYDGFHNMVFSEESADGAFLLRARREGLRDFGACMAPTTAFHIIQGLETLSLRMDRHVENTRAIIEFLKTADGVTDISYPELESHPDHKLANELLPNGCGGVFTFTLQGGREAGRVFVESLEVFSHLANIGDAKSLVIHPASTTHHRMDAEALAASGINEGTIRISVGLENIKDLVSDLKSALKRSQRPSR